MLAIPSGTNGLGPGGLQYSWCRPRYLWVGAMGLTG